MSASAQNSVSLPDYVTISPAGRTRQEFSNEKAFSYCDRHSHIDVHAGRRLAGPKHADYRYTGGHHARTGDYHDYAGARRATGSRTVHRDAYDRSGHGNEEKELGKQDSPPPGERYIDRQRNRPLALPQ